MPVNCSVIASASSGLFNIQKGENIPKRQMLYIPTLAKEGDVPSQIKAVADSSGLTPKEAADSIIADAEKLLTALEVLSEIRMKKLAVDNMNEVDVINAHRDAVLAEIKAVDDSL